MPTALRTYAEAGQFQRFVRWSSTKAPASWVYARILHHIDTFALRVTRGRHTSSDISGLPVIMLTTTGARTGVKRTLPVLGIPVEGDLVVIASNFGQRRNPGWYHNLCAHPIATVTRDDVTRTVVAREAVGDERARLWRRALQIHPGWTAYALRAADRRIPVLVLSRVDDPL